MLKYYVIIIAIIVLYKRSSSLLHDSYTGLAIRIMSRKTATLQFRTQAVPYTDTNQKYCPHCHATVSSKTFKRHKAQFYNPHTCTWQESKMLEITNFKGI